MARKKTNQTNKNPRAKAGVKSSMQYRLIINRFNSKLKHLINAAGEA